MESVVSEFQPRPLPGAFANVRPATRVATAKGTIVLYLPRPDVVVSQVDRYLDRDMAMALKEFGEKQFRQGIRCRFFHDWETLGGYESEMRVMLTSWSIDRRSLISCVDVLTKSKVVAMGVATANLATSVFGLYMHSYTHRAEYERVMLTELTSPRR